MQPEELEVLEEQLDDGTSRLVLRGELDLTGGPRAFDREGFRIEENTDWNRIELAVAAGLALNRETTYRLGPLSTVPSDEFNRAAIRLRVRDDLLPGFVAGYSKIHHDEHRHIGYGTWFLREAVREDPALGDRVRQTLRELLPAIAQTLTPPDRDGTVWDALGASGDEIREFALGGLTRRLAIVGVPLSSL